MAGLGPDLSDSQTILPPLQRGSVDLDLSIVQQKQRMKRLLLFIEIHKTMLSFDPEAL